MTDKDRRQSLASWVERIRSEEMPIFGETVQRIISVANDEITSASQLAQVILRDASMTTRVLKLVNTTYYRVRKDNISTISRAVVVLGFDTIRSLCLSVSLVDSLVRGRARDRVVLELARAIHAAVQARAMAIHCNDPEPEEVFIATLLLHVGDMAFWCFAGKEAEELDALLTEGTLSPEEAQEQVLGFRLKQLSSGLARQWRLSPLLQESLAHPNARNPRTERIQLAHELARNSEELGWGSRATESTIERIAKHMGKDTADAREHLYDRALDATGIARNFGTSHTAQAIPNPPSHAPDDSAEADDVREPPEYPEPDGTLQLSILRDLTEMLDGSANFNAILELVLEGIMRGVGMDRVAFVLVSPQRNELVAKFSLGHEAARLQQGFHFLKRPDQQHLFFSILEEGEDTWCNGQENRDCRRAISGPITRALDAEAFFVAPIIVCGKRIGLFYADRSPSGRPLDADSFSGFRLMVRQANLCLTHVTATRR